MPPLPEAPPLAPPLLPPVAKVTPPAPPPAPVRPPDPELPADWPLPAAPPVLDDAAVVPPEGELPPPVPLVDLPLPEVHAGPRARAAPSIARMAFRFICFSPDRIWARPRRSSMVSDLSDHEGSGKAGFDARVMRTASQGGGACLTHTGSRTVAGGFFGRSSISRECHTVARDAHTGSTPAFAGTRRRACRYSAVVGVLASAAPQKLAFLTIGGGSDRSRLTAARRLASRRSRCSPDFWRAASIFCQAFQGSCASP